MNLKIPGYDYTISRNGTIYNSKGKAIATTRFKDCRYVRIYKNGVRHTLSVNKLVYDLFGEEHSNNIDLYYNEKAFRYKNTDYYITSNCRAYNSKHKRFLKIIYRNGYPTVNISNNGKREAVSIIKFLMSCGGQR